MGCSMQRSETGKAPVTLRLLGRITVSATSKDARIDINGNRFHFGVLAFVALQSGMEASREKLMATLWPDSDGAQARQNLRQCLSRLRHDLGSLPEEILVIDNAVVRIRTDRVFCDAVEVLRLGESGERSAREQLLMLSGGEFLEAFGRSNESFETWMRRERDRFNGIAAAALIISAEEALAEGRAARGLVFAERLMEIDPFDERALRARLLALSKCQGYRAALHQAEMFTLWLKRELDCPPEPATQELMRALGQKDSQSATLSRTVVTKPLSGLSIAVMPFLNVGGDTELGFLADGLTEDISGQLSRLRWLLVLGRQATSAFKDRDYDVRTAATEFGVRYVLQGSVRVSMPRVRVTAQLTDSDTGTLVWAERYDREAGDIFALQDEITEHVVASIEPGLYAHEQLRTSRIARADLDNWGRIVTAVELVHRMEKEANAEALALMDEALASEPKNARVHAIKSWALFWAQHCGWLEDRATAVEAAKMHADLALRHDMSEPWSHLVVGFILSHRRKHVHAVSTLRSALDLNPSFSLGRLLLGWALIRAGHSDEAIRETGHALRLRPDGNFASVYLATHGLALLAASRFEEALPVLRAAVTPQSEYMGHYNCLISCCGHLGLKDEAVALLKYRHERLGRFFTLKGAGAELVGFAHREVFLEGLRLAGVPETVEQKAFPLPWHSP